MNKKTCGFTLIELLVVILILGILATFGVAIFNNAVGKARDAKRKADVNQIAMEYEANFSNGTYHPVSGTSFANGNFPTPPEGGSYSILPEELLTGDVSAFRVCAILENNKTGVCTDLVKDCFCITSIQGNTSVVPMPTATPTPTSDPTSTTTPTSGPTTTPTITITITPTPTPAPGTHDLDVTYISRTPRYDKYRVTYLNIRDRGACEPENNSYYPYADDRGPQLCPGEDAKKRWPAAGDTVTFTAKVVNHGPDFSGQFVYKWFIDGVEVKQGIEAGIAGNASKTFDYSWVWQSGSHKVKFVADTNSQVTETSKVNNNLEDYTNALAFRIHVEQTVYNTFNSLTNLRNTKSFEDWVQAQIDKMRTNIVAAGANERIRIDEIVVEPNGSLPRGGTHTPTDWSWDGAWGFETTEWTSAKINSLVGSVEGALLHEWGHQLGLIDSYNLNYDRNYAASNLVVPNCINYIVNVSPEENFPNCTYYNTALSGQMADLNLVPFSPFDAGSLNSNLGKRRGFFGDYLYDVPDTNVVQIIDSSTSLPITSAQLSFYQDSGCNTLPSTVIFSGTTDGSGKFTLPNRSATSFTTTLGHIQKNNPFGAINVVGCNGILLIKVEKGGNSGFAWLDISSFNLAYWAGQTASAQYRVSVALSSTPKSASSNRSDYAGGHDPSKAIDGNKTTSGNSWMVNNPLRNGDYIQVDLGGNKDINDVKIYPNVSNYADWCDSFHIDVSTDPSMSGGTRVGGTTSAPHTQVINYSFSTISGRYIRVTCDNEQNWVQLQEVEVLGPGGVLGVSRSNVPLVDFSNIIQFIKSLF